MEAYMASMHGSLTALPQFPSPLSFSSSVESKDDIEWTAEARSVSTPYLINNNVRSFVWQGATATARDKKSKVDKCILNEVDGVARAGEIFAIMGGSGSGKTTLLNALSDRSAATGTNAHVSTYVNGKSIPAKERRKITSFVEQEDALIGALTVRETLRFACQLALPKSVGKEERMYRIDSMLTAFGLRGQANTLVGTPVQKGIGGGQKRRVSVASQLLTGPKILFLDEPTSGLDSQAAFEVIDFLKTIAVTYNIIIITSIHQPSTAVLGLLDQVLLLSGGRTVYNGPTAEIPLYFADIGYKMPLYTNPAEYILNLANKDFMQDREAAAREAKALHDAWLRGDGAARVAKAVDRELLNPQYGATDIDHHPASFTVLSALLQRNFVKARRDVLAYNIRAVMYFGLALLIGTVWVRLAPEQGNIEGYIQAIVFATSFMSFMAVAYVPAYLEDRSMFVKERANGLYGPTAFMIANFITGLLPLFFITVATSTFTYWMVGFRPSADGFFYYIMWLFLDLLAAESLVVLFASIFPVFIVALATTAFANGLWMLMEGNMVRPDKLNVFWRYGFHYVDYLAYAFQGMMVNEFATRSYACGRAADGSCSCAFPAASDDLCSIPGVAVLQEYGYELGKTGQWVAILVCIIITIRLLSWAALYVRQR